MKNRILVVDDEKEIADLVSLYLKNEGYEVFTCYNGTDALCAWRGRSFRLRFWM